MFSSAKLALTICVNRSVKFVEITVDIVNGDGLVHLAELIQGQYFEKFFKGYRYRRNDDKGIGLFFHEIFAFPHGVGVDHFAALLVQDALGIKKSGGYADDLAAVDFGHATGSSTHQAGGAWHRRS